MNKKISSLAVSLVRVVREGLNKRRKKINRKPMKMLLRHLKRLSSGQMCRKPLSKLASRKLLPFNCSSVVNSQKKPGSIPAFFVFEGYEQGLQKSCVSSHMNG
jgi:hypothetical protein